jgi:CRP/FNR family transcriptional regulator, cyclic AMP receptor protein
MSTVQRFFRPGQYLFREGEPSKAMFLIKKGTVSIRKMKGAAFVEIARIYSNEVLGELSFFDRLPRSAAAIALTEVEALEIEFNKLDKIYAQVPDYMKTIIAAVADRLRKANDQIRRLQKNVVTEQGIEEQVKVDDLDAAEVLAASTDIDAAIDADTLAAIDAEVAAAAAAESGSGDPEKSG